RPTLAFGELQTTDRQRVGEWRRGDVDVDASFDPAQRKTVTVVPIAVAVTMQLKFSAADDLQPRMPRAPLRVATDRVVKPVGFAIALPDHDTFHHEAVGARVERQMLDTVALFRLPTQLSHQPLSS